jgi:hypothetical protein
MRFRCANRISIFLRSRRDVSKPSVPANDRATSRACSYVALLSVTQLYGKLFITLGLMSGLIAYLINKEMSVAIVFVLLISVNMLFTGVIAFNMTKNPAYLYVDLGRGGAILLLLGMYRFLYLKRATLIAAK